MADTKLAKVGITPKGAWSSTDSYEMLDMVLYAVNDGGDGCSYTALKPSQGVTPGTDDTVWLKSSQAGQSIYDLAVKYKHFEGTEAEFEAEYQAVLQAARDAAAGASAVESAVEAAESQRVSAESARAEAESARASAESARQSAEASRASAEAARASAESSRASAETSRATEEVARQSAETTRQSNETARGAAELSRAQQFGALQTDMETAIQNVDAKAAEIAEDIAGYEANEAGRVSAENARASAESARVSAESARVTAETARVSAENARVSAETDRATAEAARTTAETARATDEAQRAAAEVERSSAESAREAQAASDHTIAAADHTTALADHSVMQGYDTRLTDVEDEVYHSEEVPYTDSDIVRWSLSSDNMFIYSGGNKGIFLPITPGKRYVIPGANRKSVAAVLKTMPDLSTTTSKPADYATGFDGRIDILADSSFEYVFTAPEDGQYCYMQLHTSAGDVNLHLFEISSINDDVAELRTQLDTIQSGYSQIDTSDIPISVYSINSSNKWITTPTTDTDTVLVPITPGKKYRVIAPEAAGSIIAVLAESSPSTTYGTPVVFATGYSSRYVLGASEVYDFIAPDNAQTLYMLKHKASGEYCLAELYENVVQYLASQCAENKKSIESVANEAFVLRDYVANNVGYASDENGNDIPINDGQRAALKRAMQMKDIPWTALSSFPRTGSDTDMPTGDYIGIPYSSVKELRKYLCWEVSQRTFMTAVHNPYSLFYTEDVFGESSKSGYGKTYNGVNCGPYYGHVCSTFALWALGLDIPWDTKQIPFLARRGDFVKIADQSAQGLRLLDLVLEPGHCTIITGISRDASGNVISVKVAESNRPKVTQTTYTAADFESRLSTKPGTIYRYMYLYMKWAYTPSEFVAVGDETTPPPYQYNDDICFFAGDYAALRAGEACWLNYNKGAGQIDLSVLEQLKWQIDSSNVWFEITTSANTRCVMLPITPGKLYRVTGGSRAETIIAVLTSLTPGPHNSTPKWATGWSGRQNVPIGESYTFTAPEDAAALYILVHSTTADTTPIVEEVGLSYTSVKIYKDDNLIQTVALPTDTGTHKLDISSYMTGAGKYKACLTDGTVDSDFTYWMLVNTTVSYANGRVSFASDNGTPWWIQVCSNTGVAYCWYELTNDDITSGHVDLALSKMIDEQYGAVSGNTYLRVMFKADYGGVVSEMQQVNH